MTQTILNYEERIVLFIDILGFKQLVNESITDNVKLEQIKTAINIIRKTYGITLKTKDRTITQFSDSIVISFLITEKGEVALLLAKTHLLIKTLILNDIVCRGGIARGHLIHDHIFMFGKALIDAYNLESNLAIFPRVIISDKSIIQIGKENYGYHPANNSSHEEKEIKSFISIDFDGVYFIDYFNLEIYSEMSQKDKNYVNKLRSLIEVQLQKNDKNLHIKQKYEWMKDKFNESVKLILTDKRVVVESMIYGSDKSSKFYKKLKPLK